MSIQTKAYLVSAEPGDPDLLTVNALCLSGGEEALAEELEWFRPWAQEMELKYA